MTDEKYKYAFHRKENAKGLTQEKLLNLSGGYDSVTKKCFS